MKTPRPPAYSTSTLPVATLRSRRLHTFLAAAALSFTSTALFGQTTGTTSGERSRRSDSGGERGDRGGFNPQDAQARILNALRERLEVTDDEEWKLISARIAKVSELRRSAGVGLAGAGGFAGRSSQQGGGDNRDQGRASRSGGSPELAALSSAVRDKLPDAEIKTRLDRLRESRKENEVKLAKAQEELRAVLSIRQEAVAVVFGLLP